MPAILTSLLIAHMYPSFMAVRKRLQKIGGSSLGFVVSRDMLQHLGMSGSERDVVVEALPGAALLIRRADAPAVESDRIHEALAAEPDALPADAPQKEWRQRILLAVRDHGPTTTVAIAKAIGRTRESTSGNLHKLRREGLVIRTIAGWVLTPSTSAWFDQAGILARLPVKDRRFAEALRKYGPATAAEVADHLGVTANYGSRVLARAAREGWAVKTVEGYALVEDHNRSK